MYEINAELMKIWLITIWKILTVVQNLNLIILNILNSIGCPTLFTILN